MIEPGAEVFKLKILNPVPFLQAIPGPLQRIPSLAISFGKPIRYLGTRYDVTSYHPGLCNVGGDVEVGNFLSLNNLI